MTTIKIMDPVTRIEGHMKVEITIESAGGQPQIVDARCSGTLFRGFETLLIGRSPLDAPILTQRICGVCPISHGQTAVLALENVSDWRAPKNARLMRNLTLGANYIQSHILHFYLLAAADYAPGPGKAPWTPAWQVDMRPGAEAIMGNLVGAIEARRRAHEMGALFAGKMPASHAFVPGGFTEFPTAQQIQAFRTHLQYFLGFIQNTYIPDVLLLKDVYPDYLEVGTGCRNLMAYGVFEMDDAYQQRLLARGYIQDGSASVQNGAFLENITEGVKYSWYADATTGLSPSVGQTQPVYPKQGAYSWLKAPRLFGKPFEVGPLARMWVNGDYRDGTSVLDRHLARAYETRKIAGAMEGWLNELQEGKSAYDESYDQFSGFGVGLCEAPRGALGHWVGITSGLIDHYQVITPTCWNASPRDDNGIPGPMEQALIGTPIENPDQPIEALRVIHSFDPCLSCAVHVIKPDGEVDRLQTGGPSY